MDDADARDRGPIARDGDSEPPSDHIDIETVRTRLEALERTVDHPDERREVRRTIGLVDRLPTPSIREHIRKYTRRDIAEAFVGSILVSLPLLVEDGVFDIADHFVETPLFFGLNAVFVVVMTISLLYYADFREVHIHRPIMGFLPRRLTAVVVISLLTATFTMTLWGRLDGWADPMVALARISVVWTAAAFGGALGDILPGESEGEDINDELDQFGERLGIGDDEGLF